MMYDYLNPSKVCPVPTLAIDLKKEEHQALKAFTDELRLIRDKRPGKRLITFTMTMSSDQADELILEYARQTWNA